MKLTTEQARDYVITLFGFVRIQMPTKSNNENRLMAEQFKNLFMKYTIAEMKIGFQDVLHECVLPNENLSGRLPKIGRVRELLDAHKAPHYDVPNRNLGNVGTCPPNIKKTVMKGLSKVGSGDFNLKEYYIELIKSHQLDKEPMCAELNRIEDEYIELGII